MQPETKPAVPNALGNGPKKRVIVYVDGFNLYFGLRAKGWKNYYWLNIQKLALSLLKPDQVLVTTKYFTSRVSGSPDKTRRQSAFLDALGTLNPFEIHYGHYLLSPRVCRKCKYEDNVPSEKMTDVNIAVEMMVDAFKGNFDDAILITADSDLKKPIVRIKELFPGKRVVVAFPPERVSKQLRLVASAYLMIGRDKFAKSVFPDEVKKLDGHILKRPESWKSEGKENA